MNLYTFVRLLYPCKELVEILRNLKLVGSRSQKQLVQYFVLPLDIHRWKIIRMSNRIGPRTLCRFSCDTYWRKTYDEDWRTETSIEKSPVLTFRTTVPFIFAKILFLVAVFADLYSLPKRAKGNVAPIRSHIHYKYQLNSPGPKFCI